MRDSLTTDLGTAGVADPGDALQYEITLSNSSSTTASGTTLTVGVDSNAQVTGQLRSTPLTRDDVYTTDEDSPISIPSPGVLANDFLLPSTATLSIISTGTTPTLGQFSVAADGGLTYNPNGNLEHLNSTVTLDEKISYMATNERNETDQAVATVRVQGVNDTPSDIQLSNSTVPENAAVLTIGNLSSTDPDAGATFTYTLVPGDGSTDNALFSISGGNVLSSIAALNYEAAATRSVRVRTTDEAGLFYEKSFVITVTDVNEAPTAVTETYGTFPNVELRSGSGSAFAFVTSATSMLANDTDPDTNPAFNTLTAVVASGVSAQGGVYNIVNTDGRFSYVPKPGFTGLDSFPYTLSDGLNNVSGTVQVNVTGTVVWFIHNNSGSAVTGDGTTLKPFRTLAEFNTANTGAANKPANSQTVFLCTGSGAYNGGITLRSGQILIGNGEALTYGATTLINSGTRPVISNSAAGGAGVTLNTNNTIRSLDITGTTGNAFASVTSPAVIAVGTLAISSVDINNSAAGNGGALALEGGPGDSTVDVAIGSLQARGTTAISLTNIDGTVSATGGSISNASGTDINIQGGSGSFTFPGTINNTAGNSIVVNNHNGGTILFSGAITDTGSGISLTNNTGATINFTSGLSLSTTTNAAFTATGGGTVNVTQNNSSIINTIATGSGTGLNISNTNIGASGVTFRSIACNGAPNGIVLNNTGTAAGLTIVGNGSTVDSGGVISSTSGDGISLINTKSPSFHRVRVQTAGRHGMYGHEVDGLTMTHCKVMNSGNADEENGIMFGNDNGAVGVVTTTGIKGTVLIQDCTIEAATQWGLRVYNSTSNLNLTLQRVLIQNNVGTFGEAAVSIRIAGGTTKVLADDCDFLTNDFGWDSSAIGSTSGQLHVTIQNCTIDDNRSLPSCINFVTSGNTAGFLKATGNTLKGSTTSGLSSMLIDLDSSGNSSLNAIISGNTGTETNLGGALEFQVNDNSVGKANIFDNNFTITGTNKTGMLFRARTVLPENNETGSLDLTLKNNTINNIVSSGGVAVGVEIDAGTSGASPTHANRITANLAGGANGAGGNTINGTPNAGFTFAYILRQRTGTTYQLQGYSGSASSTSAVESFVQSQNSAGTLGGVTLVGSGGTHIVNYVPATASLPTAPQLP